MKSASWYFIIIGTLILIGLFIVKTVIKKDYISVHKKYKYKTVSHIIETQDSVTIYFIDSTYLHINKHK